MKRKTKIVCNKIKCKNCGEVIESKSTHDWVCCKCFQESGGLTGCFVDGGLEYLRRGGDFEDLSETRLYTDAERDEFNRNQLKLSEAYDGLFEFELME